MHYYIAKINGDNRRPGMPQEGYIVRYGLSDYGWKYGKCFETLAEAEAFAKELIK
jgi:hypothetical protein